VDATKIDRLKYSLITALREGIEFVRTHDLPTVWRAFIRRDTHPLLQFAKYGFCGVLAILTHSTVFGWLGHHVWPAFEHMTVNGHPITNQERIQGFIPSSICGFLASNTVAYFTNLLIVFTGGRHHRLLEFLYFTLASSVGYLAGLILALVQLHNGQPKSWIALATIIVTATMVNFACRKFFVFKG